VLLGHQVDVQVRPERAADVGEQEVQRVERSIVILGGQRVDPARARGRD
jgi:hypothetical protein